LNQYIAILSVFVENFISKKRIIGGVRKGLGEESLQQMYAKRIYVLDKEIGHDI
jgi:hypothetical protein